jgi:carbamoyl-phosphate synthase large subunit
LTYPANFPDDVLGRIATANEAVAKAIGIPFGITHAEFLVDEQGLPWLVEMAARGGGSFITTQIVPAVTGFHPTEALIRCLMGQVPDPTPKHHRAAQLRFLRLPAGRQVLGYPNLAALRAHPGVLEFMVHIEPGSTVPPVTDDRTRHAFVITHAETRAEADALANSIERQFVVEFADA